MVDMDMVDQFRKIREGTEPYLIQRVRTRDEQDPRSEGLDSAFEFDYMGSSEFEWGALPNALKRLRTVKESLVTRKIHSPSGLVIWFVGQESDLGTTCAWLHKHLAGQTQEKESTYMRQVLGLEECRFDPRCDGWWALDIRVPWSLFTTESSAKMWSSLVKGEPIIKTKTQKRNEKRARKANEG